MTNKERLNEMSNTELAAFICRFSTREACDTTCPARDLCHIGHNALVSVAGAIAEGRDAHD